MGKENIRSGYKPSPLGPIPIEWEVKELAEEIEQLEAGVSVNSIDEEIADGDLCILKTSAVSEGLFNAKEHKKIVSEDIARAKLNPIKDSIIISRMNTPGLVGECGYVDETYPNLFLPDRLWQTKFNHHSTLNVKWLNYLLNTPEYKLKIKSTATGTSNSMKNISKDAFLSIRIPIPSNKEQTTIANLLSTWDHTITHTAHLIVQKELRKKWLMQQLLTGKKRLKGFKQSWEDTELGELLEYEQPTKYLVKDTLYNDKYSTPVLTAGKTFILGYTNEETGICTDLPIVIFDDFTTASKYVDFPFKAKSSAMKLLRPKSNANLKFVYEAMQLMNYVVGGHERHWISKFAYLTIPCPSIEEQTAIAQVLQTADKELQLLHQKLEQLKEQKKGLMQVLLTGKKRLKQN